MEGHHRILCFFSKKWLVAISLVLLSLVACYAQNEVQATVSKKKLSLNENFVLEFVIRVDGSDEVLPDLSEFTILSGPQKSKSFSSTWVNGKGSVENKTIISYLLQPKKTGTFVIDPISITYKRKKYQSEKIEIEVTEAKSVTSNTSPSSSSNAPQNKETYARTKATDNVHLLVNVSNLSPYIGEEVLVTYKIFYRINLSAPNIIQMPKFDGFLAYDLTKDIDRTIEQKNEYYKDELYNVYTFYQVMLIPQKTGRITIDPMILRMATEIGTGRYDWMGMEIKRQVQFDIESQTLNFNVVSLPDRGKPQDFSGAVGNFNIQSKVNPKQASGGQSVSYSIILTGQGNFGQFNIPKISLPDEIERYDPQTQENVSLKNNKLKGSITEDYIIIPRYKGSYKIPAVNFSYFDPKAKSYKTLSTEEFTLDVISGDSTSSTNGTPSVAVNKKDVNYLSQDIGYIELKTNLKPINENVFAGSKLYYYLVYLPLILLPFLLLLKFLLSKLSGENPDLRQKRAASIAKTRLSKARKALKKGTYEVFYAELEDALYNFIIDKLKINRSNASFENIEDMFVKKGVSEQNVKMLIRILQNCNMARYSPQGLKQADIDYNDAIKVIENLGKI